MWKDKTVVPDDSWEGWVDLEDGEEGARVQRMCRPCVPPNAETVRKHNISGHCQYRSWCPVCVAAAANNDPHKPRPDPEGAFPDVHNDYACFRDRRGGKFNVPVLVSKYRRKRAFSAHAVPKKGVGRGYIVQQCLRDLRKWGLRAELILRSDGEPAILDLLNKVSE